MTRQSSTKLIVVRKLLDFPFFKKGDLYFYKAEVTVSQPAAKPGPQLGDPHRVWKTIEPAFTLEGTSHKHLNF